MRKVLLTLAVDVWSGDAEARGWTQLQLHEAPQLGHWAAAMVAPSIGTAATVGGFTMTLTATWPDNDTDNVMNEHVRSVAGGLDGDADNRAAAMLAELPPLFDAVLVDVPDEVKAEAFDAADAEAFAALAADAALDIG